MKHHTQHLFKIYLSISFKINRKKYKISSGKNAGEIFLVKNLSIIIKILKDEKSYVSKKVGEFNKSINTKDALCGSSISTRISRADILKEELFQKRISSTDKDLRFYMIKWIEGKGKVNPFLKMNRLFNQRIGG